MGDAAYTTQVGRKAFGRRVAIVACDEAELAAKLAQPAELKRLAANASEEPPRIVFMFPGDAALAEERKIPEIPELSGPKPWSHDVLDFTSREKILGPWLDNGRLRQLPGPVLPTRWSYHVVYPSHRPLRPVARQFVDWLLETSAPERQRR